MHDNLNRVESAVSATASGNLTWEQWPHDCAVALGFAGQRNPLGFAVVRYLGDEPSGSAALNVILHLATVLIKRGYSAKLANEAAWAAVDAWNHIKCPMCSGRGVMNIEQQQCDACNGTGERAKGEVPDIVRDGISALMEAERWMEGQLAARLRDASYRNGKDGCAVNLPMRDVQADHGFNHRPATQARKAHE